MGFLFQLKLLLWKNYTLKKRTPYLVLLEVLIPLVLFLVLTGIRLHKPPYSSDQQYYSAKAMPSAGIIPLLQSFCPNAYNHINKHGYSEFPNSRINKLLSNIADIYNSPEGQGVEEIRNMKKQVVQFFQTNNITHDSYRNIKNFTLESILKDPVEFKEFLVKNLSISENMADRIIHSSFNGKQLTGLLLERNYDSFMKQLLGKGKLPKDNVNQFQNAVLLQALFDPDSLVNGPTWIRMLSSSILPTDLKNHEKLQKFAVDILSDPKLVHGFICSNEFSKIIILQNVTKDESESLQTSLCNTSNAQSMALSEELKRNIDVTALAKIIQNRDESRGYREQILKIQQHLQALSDFDRLVTKYTSIAHDLNFNMHDIDVVHAENLTDADRLTKHAAVIWRILGPVICGNSSHQKDTKGERRDNDFIIDESSSMRALKFSLYVLTSDSKILYAPNGTQADMVISKTGHILTMIKRSKEFAEHWLNISRSLRESLTSNSTQRILREISQYSNNYPHMLEDYSLNLSKYINTSNAYLERGFAYNETVLRHLRQSQQRLDQIVNLLLLDQSGSNQFLKQLSLIDRVASVWVTVLKPIKLDPFYGFRDEKSLMEFYANQSQQQNARRYVLSAILFDNVQENGHLPRHVIYRVRMNGQLLTSTRKIRSRNWYPGPNHHLLNYYLFGFVWLQDQLERAISEVIVGRNISKPGFYIQETPYPCYLKDDFMFVIQYMMPLCITVSFIYSVAILVQNIVNEKEHRLKEVMKMMGLSNAVHWTAWFITSMFIMAVIVLLMTITLKYGGILKYSNPVIVWLFLTLSSIATTLFCFLLSVFFSKAKLAAACGGIIYFLTYMPYVFISIREGAHVKVASTWKSLASLFSTTAFGLGARYFALYEQDGKGLQWKDVSQSPLLEDEFNLGKVFAMLICDTILYGILTWYIEAVFPGAYGLPRPWYFAFQPSYWLGTHPKSCSFGKSFKKIYSRMSSTESHHSAVPQTPGLLAIDAEPIHLPLGVAIDELVKVYHSGKKAVDHLSLNLYEGQITSFLGHNGAGKTTTMSILTGLFPPTNGTAYVYGNDIRSDMDKIRTSLGMCPQHNVLFDKLTVEEHLWFYATLKGMPSGEIGKEITKILEDLDLPSKRNSVVESLSGGMKRRLSVAMAFVGGSRTVILDEPTAGVDPFARRAIWDLLVKYKKGRTILLSTHFMDEADILGDRIAIISYGKLRCCGSSLFLKSQFGDGYHLTLVKNTPTPPSAEASLSLSASSQQDVSSMTPKEITAYIRGFVPSAQLICQTQHELSYILPKKDTPEGAFKSLFDSLEANKNRIGCQSSGLTDTTLEEVFLKVTETSMKDEPGSNDLIGEVTVTRPSSPFLQDKNRRHEDSGIELDDVGSSPPLSEHVPKKGSFDDSATSYLKKTNRPTHKRSLSSDFFKDGKQKPVVTCVHRRNPCGRYCGHRRALSTGFQIDQIAVSNENVDLKDKEHHKSPLKAVLFGHRKTPSNASQISQDSTILEFESEETLKATKMDRRFQQFVGLLLKRFHHSRRNFKGLIAQILLPAIFVCIAMTVAMSRPGYEIMPRLILSPTMIRPLPNYIPFANEGDSELAKNMEMTLRQPSGVGADCVLKFANSTFFTFAEQKLSTAKVKADYDSLCYEQLQKFNMNFQQVTNSSRMRQKEQGEPKCHCSKDKRNYICDSGVEGHPEVIHTVTGDQLLNVTGMNMPKYLMFTTQIFKRHRYGALTFGEERKIVPKKFAQLPYDDVQKLFVRDAAKAWFNNKGFHAMPTYLNILSNSLLRANVKPSMGNPSSYGITAIYHPFNMAKNSLSMDYMRQGTDVVIAIFVIIAMSFVPASFVIFLVTERVSKAKHLQFVSGVDPITYWLTNFLWDMCNYLIPALACMLILYCFGLPAYASSTNFPAVCCILLLYGWSITPLMYPASFLFNEASTAYVVLIVLNLFLGVTFTVTVFILQLFPNDPQLTSTYNILRIVSLAFPNYCLGRGLMDLAFTEYSNTYYKMVGEFGKVRTPFEWTLITRSLVVMLIEGVVFFSITLFIEYFQSLKTKSNPVAETNSSTRDEDVTAEQERVISGEASEDLLRLENLTKVYHSKKTGKHLAVDRLCLGVSKGECFGLLGVNGAGKTTTFKMLTGDNSVTCGDAFVQNKSIVSEGLKVHKLIGYCPQFDALIDELTAEEHLALYSRLRGIPESNVKKVVDWAISKLALGRHAYTPCKTYSGGNKRKLSAAIALIGNPLLIFMDEPTTGMDPGARRFLWNLILSIIQKGTRSVILTSHCMEECEALCTRLAIMVNGKFECLGSTQHLKNKFGEGYIIIIRLKGNLPDLRPLTSYLKEHLPDAVLKETQHNMLQYQIHASSRVTLSDIFGCMDDAQSQFDVEDYSVSQTTLENVFINFAKLQKDSTTIGDLSFLMPDGERSILTKVQQGLRRIRSRLKGRNNSRFSTLFNAREQDRNGDDSYMEDEDSLAIDFERSNVHLELLENV
eukprot:gene15936-17537_t